LNQLKGVIKEGTLSEETLTKFDLSYIPMKYHAIFLYFLRMNQYIDSLHCRGINLKGDLIKNLIKDFVHLREFSLSFADTSQKKREIGSLIQAIMT
jgi:hypothetical protein